MSLLTIQRSPTPTDSSTVISGIDESLDSSAARQRSFSENYVTYKGAAVILPRSDAPVTYSSRSNALLPHLQRMLSLVRPQDTLRMAVRLQSGFPTHVRYLGLVSSEAEDTCILGFDCNDQTTLGLVLPLYSDTRIMVNGDGGFTVETVARSHIFKPVSVQAMWSALQALHKALEKAVSANFFPGGVTHTWSLYYQCRLVSGQACINEWNQMEDIESHRPDSPLQQSPQCGEETAAMEEQIRRKLREIMMDVDLDEVTGKYLRERVEEALGVDLSAYKRFIDDAMLQILGQLDAPSHILDHIYLGTEWNASNLYELKALGIGFVLNCTKEIDNFFPSHFEYKNVRVLDERGADLLRHWNNTWMFIEKARLANSRCLVHCKMGISRSASCVLAYVMKQFGWPLETALHYVKGRRTIIRPNEGFLQQLQTYEGILVAKSQRNNPSFQQDGAHRPRSWSGHEAVRTTTQQRIVLAGVTESESSSDAEGPELLLRLFLQDCERHHRPEENDCSEQVSGTAPAPSVVCRQRQGHEKLQSSSAGEIGLHPNDERRPDAPVPPGTVRRVLRAIEVRSAATNDCTCRQDEVRLTSHAVRRWNSLREENASSDAENRKKRYRSAGTASESCWSVSIYEREEIPWQAGTVKKQAEAINSRSCPPSPKPERREQRRGLESRSAGSMAPDTQAGARRDDDDEDGFQMEVCQGLVKRLVVRLSHTDAPIEMEEDCQHNSDLQPCHDTLGN